MLNICKDPHIFPHELFSYGVQGYFLMNKFFYTNHIHNFLDFYGLISHDSLNETEDDKSYHKVHIGILYLQKKCEQAFDVSLDYSFD